MGVAGGIRKQATVVRRWLEVKFVENEGEQVVPVARAAAKIIKSFVQEPVLVLCVTGISCRQTNGHLLIVQEGGLAESVLSVRLLEDTTVTNCFGGKQAKGAVLEDGSVAV